MDHTLVNEHVRWGIIVVTYMFLSGVGAGSLIVAVLPQLPWFFGQPVLLRLRRAAIISAAACFVVVPLAVIADLSQPSRLWRVLFAPHLTSAMSYGSYTLLLLTALIFVNLWLIHRPYLASAGQARQDFLGRVYRWLAIGGEASGPEPRAQTGRLQPVIAIVSVAAAVAFVAYTGFLLSTMTSFGLWYTPLLGVVFAVAALASGFAWLLFVASLSSEFSESTRALASAHRQRSRLHGRLCGDSSLGSRPCRLCGEPPVASGACAALRALLHQLCGARVAARRRWGHFCTGLDHG